MAGRRLIKIEYNALEKGMIIKSLNRFFKASDGGGWAFDLQNNRLGFTQRVFLQVNGSKALLSEVMKFG